jgi:hypothetical protein
VIVGIVDLHDYSANLATWISRCKDPARRLFDSVAQGETLPIALLALTLCLLICVCCTGPGLLIAGPLRCAPTEKLCLVFAGSFICIYLAGFGLFCLDASAGWYWLASGLFAAMGLMGLPTLRRLLRRRFIRRILIAFLILLAWDFLHLAMVRAYTGGNWWGDWLEHYDRTRFFLHRLPLGFHFSDRYLLPARPPLMNVLAAFFCRQVGVSFESFSLVFLFLNAWAFLPCCLMLTLVSPRRSPRWLPVLTILFMLNPSILENVTLTVTKAFTAGLVVLGLCLYLRGIHSRHGIRCFAAVVVLAAAMLSHYSACPFAAAIALHYVYTLIRRRRMLSWAPGSSGQFAPSVSTPLSPRASQPLA